MLVWKKKLEKDLNFSRKSYLSQNVCCIKILPSPIKTACEFSYVVVSSSESIGPSVRKDNGAFATGWVNHTNVDENEIFRLLQENM